jgi:hypothetical protein
MDAPPVPCERPRSRSLPRPTANVRGGRTLKSDVAPPAALLLCLAAACHVPAVLADAGDLRARHAQLQDALRDNPYGRALHIDSSEQPDRLTGDVYAVLDHPFRTVSAALQEPAHWCDILILPFNTKYCHAVDTPAGPGAAGAHRPQGRPAPAAGVPHRLRLAQRRRAAPTTSRTACRPSRARWARATTASASPRSRSRAARPSCG